MAKYSCSLCSKRFLKQSAYEDHVNSEAHKTKVQQVPKLSVGTTEQRNAKAAVSAQ